MRPAHTRARSQLRPESIFPVHARKRNVFVFSCVRQPPANCPLIVDPSSLWFRPDGYRFICGVVPPDDPNVAVDDFEVNHQEFEELVWPALAHRVPAFEAMRLDSAWAGHYDYNVFDQNAFLGPCESVPNLILASRLQRPRVAARSRDRARARGIHPLSPNTVPSTPRHFRTLALPAQSAIARAQRDLGKDPMLQLDANEVAARLGRVTLIDALHARISLGLSLAGAPALHSRRPSEPMATTSC